MMSPFFALVDLIQYIQDFKQQVVHGATDSPSEIVLNKDACCMFMRWRNNNWKLSLTAETSRSYNN